MKIQMENFKPSEEILKFKDAVIWSLIQDNKKELIAIQDEEKQVYIQKLDRWTK